MKCVIRCLAMTLITSVASADPAGPFDWPQWQGPQRDAVSRETGLLQEWTADGPPVAWKVSNLGGGYSAPTIAAGRIYGMSNRGDDEVVWALSEKNGEEVWVSKIGPAHREGPPQGVEGPGCSPTVDGDRLYVLGAGGTLACLEAKDGKVLWTVSLTQDFGGRVPMWRFNESPLIDGDKIICTPGGDEATVVALNKADGSLLWKTQVPAAENPTGENPGGPAAGNGPPGGGPPGGGRGPGGERGPGERGPGGRGGRGGFGRGPASGAGYASAIAIDFDGQRQYVQLTAKALVGIAADDGKLLWRYDRPANRMGINCSSPIFIDGQVFAASAYNAGGGLVKLSKDVSGEVKAEEVYFTNRMQNHHGGMIVHDGCLYGANGGNGGGYLVCLDFQTGEELWHDRKAPKGALTMADGRLYYRTEEGTMLLIEPNRKEYVERGRFEQPERSDSPAWSHPVIANGKLYLRDQNVLFCYDIKAP
ncbi:MAG: PQQ-binding-like beta-propeller repeat protein [Pirellulales bacterium]